MSEKDRYTHDVDVGFTVAYGITMLVALAGNVLVIYIVWIKAEVRGLTSFLFVNLAVTDLLVAVFVMPAVMITLYQEGVWSLSDVFGKVSCVLLFFLSFAILTAPIITHLAIAIDRFYAVIFPLRPLIHFRKAKYLIPLIWATTLVMMAPVIPIANFQNDTCAYNFKKLGLSWENGSQFFYTYVTVVMYLIPLVIMVVIYGVVGRNLWFHQIPGNCDKRTERRSQREKRGIVNMFIVFVTVFALCWFPANVNHFVRATDDSFPVITVAFNWIGHAHSAVNPWLIIVVHPRFAAAFGQLIGKPRRGRNESLRLDADQQRLEVACAESMPLPLLPSSSHQVELFPDNIQSGI